MWKIVHNEKGELIGDVYKVEYMSQLYNEIMKFGENMDEVDLIIEYFYKYTDEEHWKDKNVLVKSDKKLYSEQGL